LEKSSILKVIDLHVSYGPIKALKGISIEVHEGEIVVLIGANGAGKTTLVETILGITPVESGNIIFMGDDITAKKTEHIVSSGICLVPEGRGILPLMSVMENLQLGAHHMKGDISRSLDRSHKRFPVLKERTKQMAGTLSGGEQQMLSIARGLMATPKLMMLDEPSLGLAPSLVKKLFKTIVELNSSGYTILLSEQNARQALQCAHRGYVFETGNVVLSGTAHELQNHKRVQQAYLGGVGYIT
jgi:branched-chain amino acid transport system ATP-binding protein